MFTEYKQKSVFESLDDLVAVIDSRGLTVMATIEIVIENDNITNK